MEIWLIKGLPTWSIALWKFEGYIISGPFDAYHKPLLGLEGDWN